MTACRAAHGTQGHIPKQTMPVSPAGAGEALPSRGELLSLTLPSWRPLDTSGLHLPTDPGRQQHPQPTLLSPRNTLDRQCDPSATRQAADTFLSPHSLGRKQGCKEVTAQGRF